MFPSSAEGWGKKEHCTKRGILTILGTHCQNLHLKMTNVIKGVLSGQEKICINYENGKNLIEKMCMFVWWRETWYENYYNSRNQIYPEKEWSRVLFKLYATDTLDIVKLASDTNLEHQSGLYNVLSESRSMFNFYLFVYS